MEEETRFEPIVEFNVNLSKDGKYVIHKTTITSIKPINFVKKVLEGK